MSHSEPVSVSKEISASADSVFAWLAQPARHPDFDGSGMLQHATSGDVITGVGDTFIMRMHNDEMGDYEMINHVVEFEVGRRIGWEPALLPAGRGEDEGEVGERAGHRWLYQLEPLGREATLVTESYDCSHAPEWLQKAVKGGQRWEVAMTTSLERLDRLCSSSR